MRLAPLQRWAHIELLAAFALEQAIELEPEEAKYYNNMGGRFNPKLHAPLCVGEGHGLAHRHVCARLPHAVGVGIWPRQPYTVQHHKSELIVRAA